MSLGCRWCGMPVVPFGRTLWQHRYPQDDIDCVSPEPEREEDPEPYEEDE